MSECGSRDRVAPNFLHLTRPFLFHFANYL